jgi:hypothetical protein
MMDYFSLILPENKVHKFRSFEKIQNLQNLHLNINAKTNKTDRKSIPKNGLHFMCKLKKTKVILCKAILN